MKTFLRSPDRDTKQIISKFPIFFENFYDPFLSSGDVFFNLFKNARVFKKAFLSSTDTDLIRSYVAVRDEPERLQRIIASYCDNNSKEFFEAMQRATTTPSAYIYVNRAMGKDGAWRKSQFIDTNLEISKEVDTIDRCSRYLNRWGQSIRNCDWERALIGASKGDVVWLDCPRLLPTSDGRVDYVTNGFNESNHIYLNNFCRQLKNNGVLVFMAQSDTLATERIYGSSTTKLMPGLYAY